MSAIPNILHYVYGLGRQDSPFHILHYLAIESARCNLKPERIYLYYHHLPYGYFWDLLRPHLSLRRVELAQEVLNAPRNEALSPQAYTHAHHADVIRLDALIEHGGVYADIDTLFLKSIPEALYEESFVISHEGTVRDELSGELRQSLCNAVMMSCPGGEFVSAWRQEIGAAMNGSWNNHSCLLPYELSRRYPNHIRVEPFETFLGIPFTPEGLRNFLELDQVDLQQSCSVHLWQHLWWAEDRRDFTDVHAGQLTFDDLKAGCSALSRLCRPYLPEVDLAALGPSAA